MDRRLRWGLGIAIPLVLIAAGAAFVGYRRYRDRCAATFPMVTAADAQLPVWRRATDPEAQRPAAARVAAAATGTGPFGPWVSAASRRDPKRNRDLHNITLTGGNLLLTDGERNVAGGFWRIAMVDPRTGAVRWASDIDAGLPTVAVAGSTVVLANGERLDDARLRVRAAAVTASGRLAWCTDVPTSGETANGDQPTLAVTPRGDVAMLHARHSRLSVLDGRTGRVRWAVPLDAIRVRDGIEVQPQQVSVLGDRLVLGAAEDDHAVDRWAYDVGDVPLIALDAATGAPAWRYTMPVSPDGRHWVPQVIGTAGDLAVVLGSSLVSTQPVSPTRHRLAAVDRSGTERWHVDDLPWGPLVDPRELSGAVLGDLVVVQNQQTADQPTTLTAYRVADGTVAWRAQAPGGFNGVSTAAQAGHWLVLPGETAIAVVDLHTGALAGMIGGKGTGSLNVWDAAADDRSIVTLSADGVYVWDLAPGR